MAFANFSLATTYTAIITALNTQLTAVGKLFTDQTTGDFTGQIRVSSSGKRLESWNGSAWVALDLSSTAIANATNAGNADTLDTLHASAFATAAQGVLATNAQPAATAINTGNIGSQSVYSASSASSATNSTATGSIPYARYENGLRIVRGKVGSDGAVLAGTGFTASRTSTGLYLIRFDTGYTAFSAAPTVMVTVSGYPNMSYGAATWAYTVAINGTYVQVYTLENTTVQNHHFDFIAIGPN